MSSPDGVRVRTAKHLILIARQLRSMGDIEQVRLSLDGVTREITLASELELIAMDLDFYGILDDAS